MNYYKKTFALLLSFIFANILVAQVGIGTTNPSNQLDVVGWVELGDETQTGNSVEGTMRYNNTLKCIQFYDGNTWACIGRPKIQDFVLRDAIDENQSGNVNNITDYNGGSYQASARLPFVVNDVHAGDNILFLVELVVNDNLIKAGLYDNSLKIYGNGVFEEKDMPGINMEETYSSFIWANDVNSSGNLTFYFEVNMNLADAKITTLVFR